MKISTSTTQYYFNLASALDLNYYYTLNKGDHLDTILSDFIIDLNALESALDLIDKE